MVNGKWLDSWHGQALALGQGSRLRDQPAVQTNKHHKQNIDSAAHNSSTPSDTAQPAGELTTLSR